jgi:hypothetical protein
LDKQKPLLAKPTLDESAAGFWLVKMLKIRHARSSKPLVALPSVAEAGSELSVTVLSNPFVVAPNVQTLDSAISCELALPKQILLRENPTFRCLASLRITGPT